MGAKLQYKENEEGTGELGKCGHGCGYDCVEVCPIEASREDMWVCGTEIPETRLGLRFQVAEVRKLLISVKRIAEKGNKVSSGPGSEDNFIQNKRTGEKVPLYQNGKGSYLMRVRFEGGAPTDITVESGAEENVCPNGWGEQFGINKAAREMSFRSASGDPIKHYGGRLVRVVALFYRRDMVR